MTHCVDFFKKWKKEPNFCGLGKTACSDIERYLVFVDEFSSENGMDAEAVYRNVPQNAVKPILKFKKDSDIRKRASKEIAKTLKSKQAVTGKYVNSVIGIIPRPKTYINPPVAIVSEGGKEAFATNLVKDKVRLITSALSVGQLKVLTNVMEKEKLNNEYEAIGVVIKWASERLENR